jgi:hypothetical protein
MILWLSLARAEPPPELGVVWGLTVDGVPVGTREVRVRYEGDTGERIRVVEAYTDLEGGKAKKGRFAFQERLTANSHEGSPASFTAVSSANGADREVQARFGDGVWHVMLATAEGEQALTFNAGRIDLSTVDLLDPESERRLAHYDRVQILSSDLGRVLEGEVVPLGATEITVGGEIILAEGFELRAPEGSWRYWYASNGFLLRYEEPRLGRAVVGTMIGSAPRAIDEFQVPSPPVVEELDLP